MKKRQLIIDIIKDFEMKKRELDFFKTLLIKRLEELFKSVDSTVAELVSHSSQEIEYLDKASVYMDQALKLKFRTRESRLISKIKHALDRIDDNSYGVCEICGENISIRRLKARPVTTKCIECKEEEEKLEKLLS